MSTEKRDRVEAMLKAMMASPALMDLCVKAGARREQAALEMMRKGNKDVTPLAATAFALCIEATCMAVALVDMVDAKTRDGQPETPLTVALRRFEGTRQ